MNNGKTLSFYKHDIRLLETNEGVMIYQNGREYLARKWQLTTDVVTVIEAAVKSGFSYLWVKGHPSRDSAHYICFARDHQSPWEFLIGGEAKPPNLECITINKKLRGSLAKLSDALVWQNFGAKHLYVEPNIEKLSWVMDLINKIPRHELIDSSKARTLRPREVRKIGFQLEKQLEDFVFNLLVSQGYEPQRQPRAFKSNKNIEKDSIPDILLGVNKELFIIELKLNSADIADLFQLDRYACNLELQKKYHNFVLRPVLVAAYFSQDILTEVKSIDKDFELISFNYNDGKVVFENRFGKENFINHLNQ